MATGYADIRTDLTTYALHPSSGDIQGGIAAGAGRRGAEKYLTELLAQLHNDTGWIVSGFDYSSGASLTATFNGGEAIIDGHRIISTGTFDVVLEDDSTNHIWLTWEETDDAATNIAIYNATSDNPPSTPYVKIATVTTSGGSITGNTDARTTTHPLDNSSITGSNFASHKFTTEETWAALDSLAAETVTQIVVDATDATSGSISVEVDSSEEFSVAAGATATRIVAPSSDLDVISKGGGENLVTIDDATEIVYRYSGITTTLDATFAAPGGVNPFGVALMSDGDVITSEINDDKVFRCTGFSATVEDSFSSPSTAPRDIDVDSSDNVVIKDTDSGKAYQMSGFTSTVSASFSTASAGGYAAAIDPSDNFVTNQAAVGGKIYKHSGFTSTVLDSFTDASWDISRGITVKADGSVITKSYDGSSEKFIVYSGFTNTISDSFATTTSSPTGLALSPTAFAGTAYATINHA